MAVFVDVVIVVLNPHCTEEEGEKYGLEAETMYYTAGAQHIFVTCYDRYRDSNFVGTLACIYLLVNQ
jgi:hypothetical protein